MGFFDNLTGGKSRDDATAGHTAYRNTVNAYAGRARNALTQGRDSATGRLDPYAQYGQTGLDASRLYGDAIGLNGADARSSAFDTFESNPFMEYANQNNPYVLRDVDRTFSARGLAGSGQNMLAQNRVAGEMARGDVADWLNRIQGYGSQATQLGYGATGQQAGYDYNTGNALAGLETNTGNALASSHLNSHLYNANTRSTGINNLMKYVELQAQMAKAAAGAGG